MGYLTSGGNFFPPWSQTNEEVFVSGNNRVIGYRKITINPGITLPRFIHGWIRSWLRYWQLNLYKIDHNVQITPELCRHVFLYRYVGAVMYNLINV
jgi:hypothetical protein